MKEVVLDIHLKKVMEVVDMDIESKET